MIEINCVFKVQNHFSILLSGSSDSCKRPDDCAKGHYCHFDSPHFNPFEIPNGTCRGRYLDV